VSTVPGPASSLRHEVVSFGGVVERNWYLIKRYFWWELAFFVWSLANTLTIVFIAKGIEAAGGQIDVNRFEFMTETVAWERWEGTIEYTFMAPLRRSVHLFGVGVFAVLYGVLRSALLFAVIALFFGLDMPDANFLAAVLVLAVASVSFMGVGTMTSVLPLISPEKGAQLGFVAQGTLLVISGVYYPVSVLPAWMEWLSTISPATYALRGIRSALLDGAGFGAVWGDIWPLLIIGALAMPLGLWIFRRGEIYAKKHGKLKRSG
jgi:ABC-2 type transport system permease protein